MKSRIIATITIIAFTAQSSFAGVSPSLIKKLTALVVGGAVVGTGAYIAFKPADVEAKFKTTIQENLNADKQNAFDKIHPIGTAKSIKVHAVECFWKSKPPKSLNDLDGFIVRYTIYWEGPIQKDGFTKLAAGFDGEIGRFTKIEVLETNGIQKRDIANGALAILDACLQ